ncbi:unnamed protein product [Euphydryas editha]|uniref:Down syndrome cell adhesion molecule-like protein Dscam2 n=1 Tax=Euphydryas editha TaxID=104508 RepID=A0AAU9UV99_EUPED|nr:unnamed protein product [Euphydryas editha]
MFMKMEFGEALPNGTLWLGSFSAAQYRSDVHAAVYRCRAAGTVGTVLSRDMRLEAGQHLFTIPLCNIIMHADNDDCGDDGGSGGDGGGDEDGGDDDNNDDDDSNYERFDGNNNKIF